MGTISVVIISYNNADLANECIQSVLWADEIIVIDLYSQDSIKSICEQFPVRFFQHDWVPYADPVRDYGASIATSDWILHLDPDERVPLELAQKLCEIANSTDDVSYGAVMIARKNIAFGKWVRYGGYWPDRQVRFGRKSSLSYSGDIHQTGFTVDNSSIEELPTLPEFALEHYSIQSFTSIFERTSRYAKSHAELLSNNGKSFSISTLIGDVIYRFYRSFIEQKGFLDGNAGFALAVIWTVLYPIMINLYIWEIEKYKDTNVSSPNSSGKKLFSELVRKKPVKNALGYVIRSEYPFVDKILKVLFPKQS